MEFQQYAKGLATISEEDFARILLRYTNLSEASIDEYLDRVRDRIVEAKVSIIIYRLFDFVLFKDFDDIGGWGRYCEILNTLTKLMLEFAETEERLSCN